MRRDDPQSDSVSSLTLTPCPTPIDLCPPWSVRRKWRSRTLDSFPMGQAWRAVLRKSELAAVCSASVSRE